MADRALTPETRLLLAAQRSLVDRSTETAIALRRAAEAQPSVTAGPSWFLLRGAAEAYARVGEHHPLRAEITRLLRAAIELASVEGKADALPVYKGGALRHFERPDT